MKEPDTFGTYLREISRFPLLDRMGERDCAVRIAQGDKGAAQTLVQANLRFVVHLARQYRGRGMPLQELVSAGNAGLIHAAQRFDPDRNCRFVTYASWWIRRAIRDAIDESTPWASAASGPVTGGLQNVVPAARRPVSLDAPAPSGDGTLLERVADTATPSPEREAVDRAACECVRRALRRLPRRQALVLRLRFGLDGSKAIDTEALARLLGVTSTRVLQLQQRALERLRHATGPSLRALVA